MGWRGLALFTLVAIAITILRRPDAVLNPQFWAEDGMFWYADAYHIGPWRALLLPRDGYFQTISRLGGAAAQLVPLVLAPLVMNALAIGIQVLPAVLLASRRLAGVVSHDRLRVALALLWLLVPNGAETHATVTAQHWHLALLTLLLIIATPPQTIGGRAAEVAALSISSVSGLPCLFLLPVAGMAWWRMRRPWTLVTGSILAAGAALQLASLLLSPDTRSRDPLGASLTTLLQLLGGQVVIAGLLGPEAHRWVLVNLPGEVAPVAALVAMATFVAAVGRGPAPLQVFVLYGILLFAGSLVHPQVSHPSLTRWEALAVPDVAGRYWLAPTLGLIASLVWLVIRARLAMARAAAAAILSLLLIGVPLSFRYHPFVDLQYRTYVAKFEQAPPGTRFVIPINPPGWSMTLVKR